jgi:nitrogen regulatory protein PII-like uncharacterized protein
MANIYLNEDNIDDLGRMVLAMLSEFWVMRDRMAIMETLLIKAKVLGPDDIEQFSYTPEQEEEMEKLRDRIVTAVIGAPVAAKERSVEQIIERAGLKKPEMAKA